MFNFYMCVYCDKTNLGKVDFKFKFGPADGAQSTVEEPVDNISSR